MKGVRPRVFRYNIKMHRKEISKQMILVVEDEPHIRDMIRFALSNDFVILDAENVLQANYLIADKIPNLILLDWMLPDKSGIDFIRELKQERTIQEIPIIMLTAKAEERNKIKGLETGADDYITKPFSPRELVTRIKTVLRRGPLITPNDLIYIQDLCVNVKSHEVRLKNKLIKLTALEYKLLYFFITHQDRVYTRYQLVDLIWGGAANIYERTVDVQIRRLRDVLKQYNYAHLVKTVRGVGYKCSVKDNKP